MKATRLRLGKAWKEMLDKGVKFHANITLEHPYIKEYEASLLPKDEAPLKPLSKKFSSKKKKVK